MSETIKPKKRESKHWTEEEIAKLRELYPTMRQEDIAAEIGRSADSVKYKAGNIGLRHNIPQRNAWTIAEDDYLREHYATEPTRDVAKAIGRSAAGVRYRCRMLGLKKDPDWLSEAATKRATTIWQSIGENEKAIRMDKVADTRRKTLASEYRRAAFGLPQRTRMKLRLSDGKKRRYRTSCRYLFGYVLFQDEPNAIYYDVNTRRSARVERYAKEKYGINVLNIEEKNVREY